MGNSNVHEASASFRAYWFQIERALYWLATANTEETVVGVEMRDDVEIQFNDKGRPVTFLEQDKVSLKGNYPFGNLSEDLWKTLNIWLKFIKSTNVGLEGSRFFMVTNKKLPSGNRWVKKLNLPRYQSTELLSELKKNAAKCKRAELNKIIDRVLDFEDSEIKFLIERIELIEAGGVNEEGVQRKIKNGLGIASDIPWNDFYYKLAGWLIVEAAKRWDSQGEAIFSRDQILKQSNRIIREFNSKPFIEQAKEVLSVSPSEISRQRNYDYVRQLDLIGPINEEEVLEAIHDYIYANYDRSRLAKKGGSIGESDFLKFETRLIERWSTIFRPKARKSNEGNSKDLGYDIYYETLAHREPLAGYQTEEFYTTRGAYQKLSNNHKIGWHPEWKKLIK